ncbi:unnamed protein product [Blepharisma stoltei]|uniref:Mitochondrial cardiolipin hydrolase n=1 Tax=Blepharisma stoltei TaxID=1481888 RepID=A0AAU9K4F8_9CILI|nr:unnamed protein product [Blepharisma stoltei]
MGLIKSHFNSSKQWPVIIKMSDAFKTFLESKYGNATPETLREFVQGLKSTSGTSAGLSRLSRAIFEVASRHVQLDADKEALRWLEAYVLALQENLMRPLPKAREALFFPDPASEQRLIQWLDRAQRELYVCVFTITNNHLRDAVTRAHDRGVAVKVISDDECMKQIGSDIQYIRDRGIPTETDTNPDAHMHNKFVVIDKEILITGSFNWTVQAVNANQENLVVVHDPEICQQYITYFDNLWASFRPVEVSQTQAAVRIQANFRGHQARKGNKI